MSANTALTPFLLASRKDSEFQIYRLEHQRNMFKFTIRFQYGSVLGTVVSYRATNCTLPSASSVFVPEGGPLPFELILNPTRKGGSGDKSGMSSGNNNNGGYISGTFTGHLGAGALGTDLAPTGAHAQSQMRHQSIDFPVGPSASVGENDIRVNSPLPPASVGETAHPLNLQATLGTSCDAPPSQPLVAKTLPRMRNGWDMVLPLGRPYRIIHIV